MLLAVVAAFYFARSSSRQETRVQSEVGATPTAESSGALSSSSAGELDARSEASAESARIQPPRMVAQLTGFPEMDQFNHWVNAYLSAPVGEKGQLLAQGIPLAAARRNAMRQLIPSDPRRALENAVPVAVRQQLPPEVTALLEERVSAQGFFGVLAVAPGSDLPPIRREVRLASGQRYAAHVYGRRERQQTTERALVSGIAIDKALALDERPLRVLEAGEIPDANAPVVETCPVSGKTTEVDRTDEGLPPIDASTPAVEVAGTVHYLCSGGHISAFEEGLVLQEGGTGGPIEPGNSGASSRSTGARTLLYMRVAFPESNADPQTETDVYSMMRTVNDFFVENSFGNVYVLTTVTPLLTLPRSEAWYKAEDDDLAVLTDARAVAKLAGYDPSAYDLDCVRYAGGPGSFGGQAYVGSKGCWMKSSSAGVAAHEFGHNFGLWHANFWNTSNQSTIGAGANAEYGNSFDTMGAANAGNLHFNAAHKNILNWLTDDFVTTVRTSGTYRIFQYDQPRLDPAQRYAFKVVKDNDRDYWAEFRQKYGTSNLWLRDGILLNWSPWGPSAGGAHLLDTTPGSPDDKTDSAVTIGRTFSDREAGIHITPVGKGGTSPESIDVVVNLGAFTGNQPPVLSASASATTVVANGVVNFTATASDPDGDALAYFWDFGDKSFSNTNSPTVPKSWSAAGEYQVRCLVSDMKGATASTSIIVTVGAPGTFAVSGRITLAGQPLANVRVHNGLTGTSYRGTFTDSDGTYTITRLAAGSYSIGAADERYSFAAGFANPAVVGPDFTTANFTATERVGVSATVIDADCSEGTNTAVIRLTRTGSTASALGVKFLSPSGTATRTSDYTFAPDLAAASPFQSATIAAGQASLDIIVTAVDDTTAEGPENVTLQIVPDAAYVIRGSQTITLQIQDNDSTLPQVSLTAVDTEASEGGDPATFLLARTGATASSLVVPLAVTGTATSGTDYASPGASVTIPAGAASVPITISPINDSFIEGNETVIITVSSNAAYLRASNAQSATALLLDDDLPTLTVIATDSSASEAGNDTGTFVVTRTGATSQALVVNYAINGSAHHGVDYVALPGVLTIPAGSSVGSITVTPIDDAIGEPQQSIILQLRGGTGYIVGAASNATVSLADNDSVVVTVGVSDGAVSEPSDTGKFKFTTAGSGSGNITVRYTVSGTATAGADYTALAGTLSIGRNTTAEVTVTPVNDSTAEDRESVTVTITPDPAYTTFLDSSATLFINDDDRPIVHVSKSDETFAESGGTAKFYISRTGATTAALTVNYTMSGTATNGADYTALSGTTTIPAAQSGVYVDVVPINDTVTEGVESVIFNLAPGNYGIGLASAVRYLTDSRTPAVQVRFGSGSSSAGENAGAVTIPVTLSAASGATVTVEYEISGGSATGTVDYIPVGGVLTFEPGITSRSIVLTVKEDTIDEPTETVAISLRNPNGAALGTSTHTLTINDNDTAPAGTVGFAGTAASGSESVTPAAIVVSLSAPATAPVSVSYAVTGGTATAGSDYTLAAGTLAFAIGDTAKIIPNTVENDAAIEPDEEIVVTLSNATGATLTANAVHTFTITDDDTAVISLAATDATASEPGVDGGMFTFTRTGNTANALTVNFTVSGSASAGTDYTSLGTNVSFAAGAATVTLPVSPLNDTVGEGNETVVVALSSGANYNVGTPATATVTIADDEPTVFIVASDAAAAEIGNNLGEITLTRSGSTVSELTVNVSISGTATSGADYQPVATPVVIPAGSAAAVLSIIPIDDTAPEGAETVTATVTGGAYLVSAPASATVTIADDDINNAPVISLVSPTTASIAISTGVGLLLEATATDDGKPLAPGVLATTWSKVSGPGTVTFGSANQVSTTAQFSIAGTYVVRFTAHDGELLTSTDVTVRVGSVIAPWTSQDIGTVGLAGSFTESNGRFTVRGAGANISGTSDGFHFVTQQLTGDGEIKARLVSMTGGASSSKAGVMIRNTTAANSRAVFMSSYSPISPSGANTWRARTTDGGSYATANTSGVATFPTWVRVVRSGNTFSGFTSTDGTTWRQVGTTSSVTMNSQVLIGLGVTSNNTGALCTAVFDNVTLSIFPPNLGPTVNAGEPLAVTIPAPANLVGVVTDDGKPVPPADFTTEWTKVSGPGEVTFADASAPQTSATVETPGSYVLRLIADDGEVRTFDDVTVSAVLPTVSIQATDSTASEHGLTTGEVTISRNGPTTGELIVSFTAGGAATSGSDFAPLGNNVAIPLGQTSVVLTIAPLADTLSEGSETVTLTLGAEPAYLPGSPASATVTISDLPADAWRFEKFGAAANDPVVTGDTVDADGDGMTNLLERALAAEPLVSDSAALPQLGREGNDLTFTYRRPVFAPDLQFTLEESLTWSRWLPANATEEVLSDDGNVRVIKARVPIGDASEKMLRLRVTGP